MNSRVEHKKKIKRVKKQNHKAWLLGKYVMHRGHEQVENILAYDSKYKRVDDIVNERMKSDVVVCNSVWLFRNASKVRTAGEVV